MHSFFARQSFIATSILLVHHPWVIHPPILFAFEGIYGNNAIGIFGFSENHGSSYDQRLGPTNSTATPTIRNLAIRDVHLTDVRGPGVIFTLAEAPIENFSMHNVTWAPARGVRAGYACTGWRGTEQVTGLFATGEAVDVNPPLNISRGCEFLSAV